MTTASDLGAMSISEESESAIRHVDLPHGNPPRSARPRASSVTPAAPAALPRHADEPGTEITERDEALPVATVQERAQKAADDLAERVKGKFSGIASGPSLFDAHPPTLREAHEHLRDCMGHLEGDLWKWLRGIYGYVFDLPTTFILYAAVWMKRSPWGLLITAFAVFVIWKWF